jgi:hypothetical protein
MTGKTGYLRKLNTFSHILYNITELQDVSIFWFDIQKLLYKAVPVLHQASQHED